MVRQIITTSPSPPPPPKTRSSKGWVAISPRVATALQHRAEDRTPSPAPETHGGFVFHKPNGQPLHPEYVLNHFHYRSKQAGIPRTTVHDLRHLAATISITAGVPLTVVSKTLRHSTLSTTANIYSHLTTQAARNAVISIDRALTEADCASALPIPVPRPRPQSDHNAQSHNRMTIIKPRHPLRVDQPTPGLPQRSGAPATTMRPPPPETRKRPPSHRCENGLRPA
ncbi:site-specific integrase [Kitasatospora sp. MAP5-34]|uniref:tyrosine-type recombinase/integrase n=1 Tax=Kitasatospora sp. MAP5-34 TaxID=3035102 RepID=UPI002474D4C6|nr:site-specific integrase [Kitasatospora sp. MAP5-34]MDH6580750.1 hypothetical protein [Kitasatospora sp. MAP5-34]